MTPERHEPRGTRPSLGPGAGPRGARCASCANPCTSCRCVRPTIRCKTWSCSKGTFVRAADTPRAAHSQGKAGIADLNLPARRSRPTNESRARSSGHQQRKRGAKGDDRTQGADNAPIAHVRHKEVLPIGARQRNQPPRKFCAARWRPVVAISAANVPRLFWQQDSTTETCPLVGFFLFAGKWMRPVSARPPGTAVEKRVGTYAR